MKSGNYYKHKNGRDMVIFVLDVEEYSLGREILFTTHTLSYYGIPQPAVDNFVARKHFSLEELDNWVIYEDPDRRR